MSVEQRRKNLQEEVRAKLGLEILFTRPEPRDGLDDLRAHDIPKELRERYWIREVGDAGCKTKVWTVAITVPQWIERQELGRDRNQPGDGFRYTHRAATDGTASRAEWFEVTEVFEGVEAKDVEAFMRVNNGKPASSKFDPDKFLRGLDMGIPCRAAERRAADRVIAAVETKVNRPSYEGMWRTHGYGTLVVGLPLWFATIPADPLRIENVLDDFMTRVGIGLKPSERQLKKKRCPFWRIVVVWMVSRESLCELRDRVRYDAYDDPAYLKIGNLPLKLKSFLPLQSKMMSMLEEARKRGEGARGFSRQVAVSYRKKQGEEEILKLPWNVDALKEEWDRANMRRVLDRPFERAKWRAMQRAMEVLCFLHVHGLSGLSRWVTSKLSPSHRITQLAMRHRALRLYRASRRRQAMKEARQVGAHESSGQ